MVCLWLTLAMLCFWLTEQPSPSQSAHPERSEGSPHFLRSATESQRWFCYGFATCCALGVLTKGLIGVVFPIAIVAIYLLLTRGWRGAIRRILELHPFSSALVFLALAAPWHVLAAWQNPARGFPGGLTFAGGHWHVPLPTDGNVHGWAWFYFVNEQVLRYLNLRVPRDYDTVPALALLGPVLHLADAVVGVCVQGCCKSVSVAPRSTLPLFVVLRRMRRAQPCRPPQT